MPIVTTRSRPPSAMLIASLVGALAVLALTVFSFVIRPGGQDALEPLWKQAVSMGSGVLLMAASFLAMKRLKPKPGAQPLPYPEAAKAFWTAFAMCMIPALGGFWFFGMRGDGMAMLPIGACSFLILLGVLLPAQSAYSAARESFRP